MAYIVFTKKQISKVVVSTVLVTSSLGIGNIYHEQIVYSAGDLISSHVRPLDNGFNGEATTLIIKSDEEYPFSEGDQFHIVLPSGVAWNDSYTLEGTVTNAVYQQMDERRLQFTVTGNPNEIVVPLQVRIDEAEPGPLELTVEAPPNSSVPVGKITFVNVVQASGGGSGSSPTTPPLPDRQTGTITVQSAPTFNNGFSGEATKLIIWKGGIRFEEGSTFHVNLPTGVSWKDSYTSEGTVTNATYLRTNDHSIQFTVTGNPTQITIPLEVDIRDAEEGALMAAVNAPSNSSVPSGSVIFGYVGSAIKPSISHFYEESTPFINREQKMTFSARGPMNEIVSDTTVYLSFSSLSGGGTASVGDILLNDTPKAFTTDSRGQITVTYSLPTTMPLSGSEAVIIQDRMDEPTIKKVKEWSFGISQFDLDIHRLANGKQTLMYTARNLADEIVPNAPVYLYFVPEAGGTATVGDTPLTEELQPFFTDSNGQISVNYDAPNSFGPGQDALFIQDDLHNPTVQNGFIDFNFGKAIALHEEPFSDGIQAVTISVVDSTTGALPNEELYIGFEKGENGGSAKIGEKELTSELEPFMTDANGQLKLTYKAPSVQGIESSIDHLIIEGKDRNMKRNFPFILGPQVNPISDKDTQVTGKTGLYNSNISVSVDGKIIGYAKANMDGNFTVDIPAQSAGAILDITSINPVDKATTRVRVEGSLTQPEAPKVDAIVSTSNVVTGTAGKNQTVIVRSGDTILGTGEAGEDGTYSIAIPPQKSGTVLKVAALDENGLESTPTSLSVLQDECFIATASFGSKFEPNVVVLREFRDKHLMTNSLGMSFVKFYYRYSPPIARHIAGNETKKALVRGILAPMVCMAKAMLNNN